MNYNGELQDASILADAYQKPHISVPIIRATPESLIGYGSLVQDFHAEDVVRVTWPKSSGWRSIVSGTGNKQVNVGNARLSTDAVFVYVCDIHALL